MNRNVSMRRIDLDTYTEGDVEFKRELAGLLVANILELGASLRYAIDNRKVDKYLSACHKLKPSIGILNADDFAEILEAIRQTLQDGAYPSSMLDQQLADFYQLSGGIIECLKLETA